MQSIFPLIDGSVSNKNDSCSVFQMVAQGHNTFIESTSFKDSSFQLVVRFILISNSEGAQFAPNITASVKAASTFFNIEFKLIVKSASGALRSEGVQASPTKLNHSKTSFHFCKDCRIFCEGEWEWKVKDNGKAVVKRQSANGNYVDFDNVVSC